MPTINDARGFFAYPSQPPGLSEVITTATEQINKIPHVTIKCWEQLKIGGRIIIDLILKEIDSSNLFLADLTGFNSNVFFELGYAIAKDKRIWPIYDETRKDAKKDFTRFKTLTTLGYRSYTNSIAILNGFHTDSPYTDLENTVYRTLIQASLSPQQLDTVLYLKSRHDTEASTRITSRLSSSPAAVKTDDPLESNAQTLAWYARHAYSARAVICHLTDPCREDAVLANARQSLVAGMAFGFGRPLLMLAERDFLSPLDYRDIVFHYGTAAEAKSHLEGWLQGIETEITETRKQRRVAATQLSLAIELKALDLGESIAENESIPYIDDCFVETRAYLEALNGHQRVFVGRKGAGKTAILLKLDRVLRTKAGHLVCSIRPAAYEIQAVARLLRSIHAKDIQEFAIESIWKFLIYSEIAKAVSDAVDTDPGVHNTQAELRLWTFVRNGPSLMQEEFSIRLESCLSSIEVIGNKPRSTTIQEFRKSIAEQLHGTYINELKRVLVPALNESRRVAVLIDNLDKAWDKSEDYDSLANVLFGLLQATRSLGQDLKRPGIDKEFEFSLALFLRADIYYRVLAAAREPDKMQCFKIEWTDPQTLLRVPEERFAGSHPGESGETMWSRYFCPVVCKIPTKEYLLSRIFMRPRDLLFFLNAAIAIAVNRRHGVVEVDDILSAEIEYSRFALDSITVENTLSKYRLDDVLIEFMGCPAISDVAAIHETFRRARVDPSDFEMVRDYLCALGFLGAEVGVNIFRFAENVDDFKRLRRLADIVSEKSAGVRRYKINPPFHAYLEVQPS